MNLEGIVAASQGFFMTQGDNLVPKGMQFTVEALRSPDGDDVIPTKPRDTFDEAVGELSSGKNIYENPEKSPNISILVGRPEDGFWTHTFEFNRKDKEMLFVITMGVVADRQKLFDDLVVYLAAFNSDIPTGEILQMVQNNPLYAFLKPPKDNAIDLQSSSQSQAPNILDEANI
ncbi:MAG: hypothetical protein HY430_03165 [Candidatus Levybacteria bacterium]|nr:hypothetical protein [Candidatus Levybacteria bacterium]